MKLRLTLLTALMRRWKRSRSNTLEPNGEATEISMLAMFCMAIRRDVFEQVGPLDEQFEVGMFEDDDYARRVRQAGYKIICAEDVFVHHFGQASLGELCVTGEYDRVLESNRGALKQSGMFSGSRMGAESRRNINVFGRPFDTVAQQLPSEATVLVITKGDEELLDDNASRLALPSRRGGPYPNLYPADSAEAIAQLESGRANGAGFLLIPKPALWWLDYYTSSNNIWKAITF